MNQSALDLYEYFGNGHTESILNSRLSSYFEKLGIHSLTYVALLPPEKRSRSYSYSTYPSNWVKRYIAKDYLFTDPLMARSRSTTLPIQWGESHTLECSSKTQKNIISESWDIGHKNGISIPIRGKCGEFACFVGVTDETPKEFDKIFPKIRDHLLMACIYYHHAIWETLSPSDSKSFIALHKQQIEILRLASMGKSVWEISRILCISESNVKYHIAEAVRKLDTHGITATVSKAIALGIIAP